MNKQATSAGRLRRLNRRQRKKLHLGQFQEMIFEFSVRFEAPLGQAAHDAFVGALFDWLDARGMYAAGLGGTAGEPLAAAEGMAARWGRASATDADRDALTQWLRARPEVGEAHAEPLMDGWYGWKSL